MFNFYPKLKGDERSFAPPEIIEIIGSYAIDPVVEEIKQRVVRVENDNLQLVHTYERVSFCKKVAKEAEKAREELESTQKYVDAVKHLLSGKILEAAMNCVKEKSVKLLNILLQDYDLMKRMNVCKRCGNFLARVTDIEGEDVYSDTHPDGCCCDHRN